MAGVKTFSACCCKTHVHGGADSGDLPVLGHCHSREVQTIQRPPQQSAPTYFYSRIVYQSFCCTLLELIFLKICFGMCRQVISSKKNDISGFIWHKSFIKTVEYSFFNQSFVNQHFCGARHSRCNIFFFKLICVSAHVGRSFVKYTLSSYEWSGLWFGTWRLIDLISFYAIVDKNDIS